jgi:tetrahydromethanopterin S-methyltransferase subunit D
MGGVLGGIGGGVLPDTIDTPTSPNHRAAAHSMSITGSIGYFLNQQLPEWQKNLRDQGQHYAQFRSASSGLLPQIGYGILEFLFCFLSGLLAGLLAGYASHLALDSLTPSSLPILC